MVSAAPRAEAVIDLRAIRANVSLLRDRLDGPALMAVVKADGYGHGLVASAAAARAGGADWLGVAVLEEALALRAAGDSGPILSWLAAPEERWADAIGAGIDVAAYSTAQLAEICAAAQQCGAPAAVQLKADTGLGRGGAMPADWPALVAAARRAEVDGLVQVSGVWSHFAYADEPDHPTIAAQERQFAEALAIAEAAGLRPRVRHLANSAATLTRPSAWYDLVRPGLAVYGLSPVPDRLTPADVGLRPAMSLRARLALVKRVPAGQGVSYGHAYTTPAETTLGLIAIGYADGIPRHASNTGPVWAAGRRRSIAGRVCMDQFVLDLGDDPADAGDEVVLFGPGDVGEPTAQDWAEAAGTISYEIVARIGGRIPRRYLGAAELLPDPSAAGLLSGADDTLADAAGR
jgi:alanine racemase